MRKRREPHRSWTVLAAVALSVGCLTTADERAGAPSSLGSARIVGRLAPGTSVEGTFDPRVRVYGYSFDATAGIDLTVTLDYARGADGSSRDTRMELYGPLPAGPLDPTLSLRPLAVSDDQVDSRGRVTEVAAPPLSLWASAPGQYLVLFWSFEETGAGAYRLSLSGSGERCRPGSLDVQGALQGDQLWDVCDVSVRDTTTVEGRLRVWPGVRVTVAHQTSRTFAGFESVLLAVEDDFEARGTATDPITFEGDSDESWVGISLLGRTNTIAHVRFEDAVDALRMGSPEPSTTKILDSVFQAPAVPPDHPATIGVSKWTTASGDLTMRNTVVAGFTTGISWSNASRDVLDLADSTLRNNSTGLWVPVAGRLLDEQCSVLDPEGGAVTIQVDHCEVSANGKGIAVAGNARISVERSNLVDNRDEAFTIPARFGSRLTGASHLSANNITSNGTGDPEGYQVTTHHLIDPSQTLDLSGNYWGTSSRRFRSVGCGGTVSSSSDAASPIADAGPRASPPAGE